MAVALSCRTFPRMRARAWLSLCLTWAVCGCGAAREADAGLVTDPMRDAGAANDAGLAVPDAGTVVTLIGSGFGPKAMALPFFWQNYSSTGSVESLGYAGDQLAFGSNSYGSTTSVDTHGGRRAGAGALKLLMAFTGSGDRDYFPHLAIHTSNQAGGSMSATDLYLSFWLKFVRTAGTHNHAVQLKGPRSGSGAIGTRFYSGLFNYVPSLWFTGDGTFTSIYQETRTVAGVTSLGEHFNTSAASAWDTGDWNFVEFRMHLNTPGIADGYFRLFLNGRDGSAGWDPSGHPSYDQVRVREVGDTHQFNWSFLTPGIDFPGLTAGASYEVSFAEHYVDTTFARVVATDNATYASSTKWAMQSCSGWSDTSIRIDTPNWGNLASTTAAYFHVFNSAGVLVASVPVTVP